MNIQTKPTLCRKLLIVIGMTSFVAMSHNTNVTHPVITLEAIRLIQAQDQSAFQFTELYRMAKSPKNQIKQYPLHWGVWDEYKSGDSNRLTSAMIYANMDDSKSDENASPTYNELYDNNEVNVITGVVREDHPFTKVLSHFYHAYSGIPLTTATYSLTSALNTTSKERAAQYFTSSINEYGYEIGSNVDPEEWDKLSFDDVRTSASPQGLYFAKQLAFQTFGEALHHVEDMSSVAHVQNDAHLTINNLVDNASQEKDDYEGHYIPNKVFQFHGVNSGVEDQNWSLNTVKPTVISELLLAVGRYETAVMITSKKLTG